jgi:aquaporin Z
MFDKVIAEILGTFLFLSVIIITVSNRTPDHTAWFKIGLALGVAILLVGNISGGHLNPAVSTMFYLNGNIDSMTLFYYIIAQLIGASLAYLFYSYYYKKNI